MRNIYIYILIVFLFYSCKTDNTFVLNLNINDTSVDSAFLFKNSWVNNHLNYDTLAIIPITNGKGKYTFVNVPSQLVTASWKGLRANINFALEADGEATLDISDNDWRIVGGKINDSILYEVEKFPEYKMVLDDRDELQKRGENYNSFTQKEKDEYKDEHSRIFKEMVQMRRKAYWNVYNDASPKVKLLLLGSWNFMYPNNDKYHRSIDSLSKLIDINDPYVLFMKESSKVIKIKDSIKGTIVVGAMYKPFNATDSNGNQIELSNVIINNKFTLLEFWASWCSPCRAEIPHMKSAYKKYKDRGFEIFAVSIDDNEKSWRDALKKEDTKWINTIITGDNKKTVLLMYNVSGIPANLLLDSNGKIIGVNLRGDSLDKKLKEVITNKAVH